MVLGEYSALRYLDPEDPRFPWRSSKDLDVDDLGWDYEALLKGSIERA